MLSKFKVFLDFSLFSLIDKVYLLKLLFSLFTEGEILLLFSFLIFSSFFELFKLLFSLQIIFILSSSFNKLFLNLSFLLSNVFSFVLLFSFFPSINCFFSKFSSFSPNLLFSSSVFDFILLSFN